MNSFVATDEIVSKQRSRPAAKALASANVRARFVELGLEPVGHPPDEFAAVIKTESSRWAKLIKANGIKAE